MIIRWSSEKGFVLVIILFAIVILLLLVILLHVRCTATCMTLFETCRFSKGYLDVILHHLPPSLLPDAPSVGLRILIRPFSGAPLANVRTHPLVTQQRFPFVWACKPVATEIALIELLYCTWSRDEACSVKDIDIVATICTLGHRWSRANTIGQYDRCCSQCTFEPEFVKCIIHIQTQSIIALSFCLSLSLSLSLSFSLSLPFSLDIEYISMTLRASVNHAHKYIYIYIFNTCTQFCSSFVNLDLNNNWEWSHLRQSVKRSMPMKGWK